MLSEKRFKEKYVIPVGDRKYIFENVPLTQGAIGNWGLSLDTIKGLMKSICVEILSDKEKVLTFAELDFLAQTGELLMVEIAAMAGVTKSLISKWKDGSSPIQYAHSYCLKDKLWSIIFAEEDKLND